MSFNQGIPLNPFSGYQYPHAPAPAPVNGRQARQAVVELNRCEQGCTIFGKVLVVVGIAGVVPAALIPTLTTLVQPDRVIVQIGGMLSSMAISVIGLKIIEAALANYNSRRGY